MGNLDFLDELRSEDYGCLNIFLVLHLKIRKLEQCSRKKMCRRRRKQMMGPVNSTKTARGKPSHQGSLLARALDLTDGRSQHPRRAQGRGRRWSWHCSRAPFKKWKIRAVLQQKNVPPAKEAADGSRRFDKNCPRQIIPQGWPPRAGAGSD